MTRSFRFYTPEEDEFIRKHEKEQTLAWIGKQLERHPDGVRKRMIRLGLRHPYRWSHTKTDEAYMQAHRETLRAPEDRREEVIPR